MKLTYKNNWEYDEYYVDGKRVKELIRVSFEGKEYDVHSRRVSVSYSDLGHTYSSTSTHFFIKERILGAEVEIDLNRIVPRNSKITPTIYTLEE